MLELQACNVAVQGQASGASTLCPSLRRPLSAADG